PGQTLLLFWLPAPMSTPYQSPVCLAVLNPKGRDPHLDYAEGPSNYDPQVHAPVNFHAYAAATFGTFSHCANRLLEERDRYDAVLVVILRRVWVGLEAVRLLEAVGMRDIVAVKGGGHIEVSVHPNPARAVDADMEVLSRAAAILSPTLAWPLRL